MTEAEVFARVKFVVRSPSLRRANERPTGFCRALPSRAAFDFWAIADPIGQGYIMLMAGGHSKCHSRRATDPPRCGNWKLVATQAEGRGLRAEGRKRTSRVVAPAAWPGWAPK